MAEQKTLQDMQAERGYFTSGSGDYSSLKKPVKRSEPLSLKIPRYSFCD